MIPFIHRKIEVFLELNSGENKERETTTLQKT